MNGGESDYIEFGVLCCGLGREEAEQVVYQLLVLVLEFRSAKERERSTINFKKCCWMDPREWRKSTRL